MWLVIAALAAAAYFYGTSPKGRARDPGRHRDAFPRAATFRDQESAYSFKRGLDQGMHQEARGYDGDDYTDAVYRSGKDRPYQVTDPSSYKQTEWKAYSVSAPYDNYPTDSQFYPPPEYLGHRTYEIKNLTS